MAHTVQLNSEPHWTMDPLMPFAPGSPRGSIVNVVACSAMTLGCVYYGIAVNPFGFIMAGVGALMTAGFVAIVMRANRP